MAKTCRRLCCLYYNKFIYLYIHLLVIFLIKLTAYSNIAADGKFKQIGLTIQKFQRTRREIMLKWKCDAGKAYFEILYFPCSEHYPRCAMFISLCFINSSTSSRLTQLQGRKWYDDWNKPSQSTKFPQTLKAVIGKRDWTVSRFCTGVVKWISQTRNIKKKVSYLKRLWSIIHTTIESSFFIVPKAIYYKGVKMWGKRRGWRFSSINPYVINFTFVFPCIVV